MAQQQLDNVNAKAGARKEKARLRGVVMAEDARYPGETLSDSDKRAFFQNVATVAERDVALAAMHVKKMEVQRYLTLTEIKNAYGLSNGNVEELIRRALIDAGKNIVTTSTVLPKTKEEKNALLFHNFFRDQMVAKELAEPRVIVDILSRPDKAVPTRPADVMQNETRILALEAGGAEMSAAVGGLREEVGIHSRSIKHLHRKTNRLGRQVSKHGRLLAKKELLSDVDRRFVAMLASSEEPLTIGSLRRKAKAVIQKGKFAGLSSGNGNFYASRALQQYHKSSKKAAATIPSAPVDDDNGDIVFTIVDNIEDEEEETASCPPTHPASAHELTPPPTPPLQESTPAPQKAQAGWRDLLQLSSPTPFRAPAPPLGLFSLKRRVPTEGDPPLKKSTATHNRHT